MRFLALLSLLLAACACFSQLGPTSRTIRKISDPKMVIDDRGSLLEILPTKRATPSVSNSGKTLYRVFSKEASAPIGPKQLGVVFNYAMQAEGYTTGEIGFKFKGNQQPDSSSDWSSLPGFKKLTNPNVYLVVARSPAELITLFKALKARSDLEWVEPIVIYGPAQIGAAPR